MSVYAHPDGHTPERNEGLMPRDFGDVVAKLFLALAWAAAGALRLDDGQHRPGGIVEAIVRDAVPRLRVVAIDRNLRANLGAIAQIPARRTQSGIDQYVPCLGLVKRRYASGFVHTNPVATLSP